MSSHRVQVTLNPDTFKVIQRVASLTGRSMSSIIANLLNPNLSALQELGDALEKVKALRDGLPVHADDVFRAACEYVVDNVINDDAQDLENVITSPAPDCNYSLGPKKQLHRRDLESHSLNPLIAPIKKEVEQICNTTLVEASPRVIEQWEIDEIMERESHDYM